MSLSGCVFEWNTGAAGADDVAAVARRLAPREPEGRRPAAAAAGASVAAGAAVALVAAAALLGRRRKRARVVEDVEAGGLGDDDLALLPRNDEAPRRFDMKDVVLGEELGRGGFGVVASATVRLAGGAVACAAKRERRGRKPRADNEARIMARLGVHDNVLGLLGVAEQRTLLFRASTVLLLERASISLRDALRNGAVDAAAAPRFAEDGAEALAHLALRRVVHRDVKPSNFLVALDGSLKLSDFGSAVVLGGAADRGGPCRRRGPSSSVVGSVYYVAPELVDDRAFGSAVDVYSFGVTLAALFAAPRGDVKALFAAPIAALVASGVVADGESPAELSRAIAAGSLALALPPLVDAPTARLVRSCVRLRPSARPTAREVADAYKLGRRRSSSDSSGPERGLAAAPHDYVGADALGLARDDDLPRPHALGRLERWALAGR
ncbi:hypothetical protein AURANDRAFT_68062 [Aureococcus anophagefferens]|uniref:Protein kinase domain-containing protein n=1 Tax=Aureococcus anophagefferens TaxID=44056 RepID=F0YND3_AURAN|nr:hypothetical protein AURANDRAFT_68062 [Aureococcus anophagefferens]EGB03384.1 hypothetical protein AURANDRAFT_68062 [Aureococcus anophagefferens]|eukprot:XP_009041914.1 hypothetical protein AURANDRAFT_68062 [Aureococcus anophagefferens]